MKLRIEPIESYIKLSQKNGYEVWSHVVNKVDANVLIFRVQGINCGENGKQDFDFISIGKNSFFIGGNLQEKKITIKHLNLRLETLMLNVGELYFLLEIG